MGLFLPFFSPSSGRLEWTFSSLFTLSGRLEWTLFSLFTPPGRLEWAFILSFPLLREARMGLSSPFPSPTVKRVGKGGYS